VISLRIFHPGRHVWRVRQVTEDTVLNETWLSLRQAPPDWNLIFRRALDLIWLPNASHPGRVELEDQHGSITWQERRFTTKIHVRIQGFSSPKRALVAATLLKAARFYEVEEA
jgi:hypothetical protein